MCFTLVEEASHDIYIKIVLTQNHEIYTYLAECALCKLITQIYIYIKTVLIKKKHHEICTYQTVPKAS